MMFSEDETGLGEIEKIITRQPPIGQKDDLRRFLHQEERMSWIMFILMRSP